MQSFTAYLIEEIGGKSQGRFVEMDASRLDPGEVTIRVAYSSVNYKDALAATGAGRIVRRYPCIGGIDLAGFVEESSDDRFRPGDPVVATGFDIGVAHHGGYAQLARLPADWVVPLPAGLSLQEAMALGTAGFSAALAIVRMEENRLAPCNGPVVVSGATGGVGSLAIDMLSGLGYSVSALTGKESEADYLTGLGAAEVILRPTLDLSRPRPLEKSRWAGAVDNLGGPVLAWMASTMKRAGTIASVGLAERSTLETTVMPFILRGICLLGIDSGYIGGDYRQRIWQRLASDLRPSRLPDMTRIIGFDELPSVFDNLLSGLAHGRVVVKIG